ncbi:hypothetical protein J7E87_20010 [Streptomyces sp. ISL-1]|uniref:hypothetical protein n=1 Tax=Streptomyces sp. ISL-1 TaxID=2817657 RepID=UPI001BEA7F76|nr:hypothetical protein [Streptomyces sp. ISL-1]MBT2391656.1 hypothetical protein [Streptomyces sp. ISL-1]
MSTPPLPGKGLSVKTDQELHDDLAVMMAAGMTASAAVKHAVSLIASAYRQAWAAGAVPKGEQPRIIAYQVGRYAPGDTASEAGMPAPHQRR